ncbi:MAG: futalosine hydrolase [Phycisphaerales bacterium]
MSLRELCSQSRCRILFVVAAPKEAAAIAIVFGQPAPGPWERTELAPWADLLATGVGKSNAAGATARLLDPSRHGYVLNAGIAGVLPGSKLPVGAVVSGERSVFGDEGVLDPSGFTPMSARGFPPGRPEEADGVSASEQLLTRAAAIRVRAIATVSTCSGTDALAAAIVARTGAEAEAMEGAAVGLVASRLSVGFAEVRVISNATGDNAGQTWDLAGALGALTGWAARVSL